MLGSVCPVINGTAHATVEITECSNRPFDTDQFPPGISYVLTPQLKKSSLPKGLYRRCKSMTGSSSNNNTPLLLSSSPGSTRLPYFFYDFNVMANLWSIGGIRKEFIVSMDIVKDIYMGKITKWNDIRLAAMNQGK